MSLIQEALKRKSEEEQNNPLPPAAVKEPKALPEKATPPALFVFLTVLLVIGIFALLTNLAFFLIRTHVSHQATERPVLSNQPAQSSPAGSNEPKPSSSSSIIETRSETPAPVPASIPVVNEQQTELPKPASEIITWPTLHLSGIATGAGQQIAIINGKMLSAGRTLDGVTIIKVRDTEVAVEYRGEQRILHVDE